MEKAFYVLPQDKTWAINRINELEKQIDALGPEFEEVFAQSSETYHDNAPFDALRDRQSVLAAERHSLKQIINKATLKLPKPAKNKVGLGCTVVVEENAKTQTFYIAGHWSPHTGMLVDGALVITCESPIGKALMGVAVGKIARMSTPARELLVKSLA